MKINEKSLRKFGISSASPKAVSLIEQSLQNFVQNSVKRAERQAQREGAKYIEAQHVQQVFQQKQFGGAETTMPLEYYGVDSKHYFDDAPMGTDMSVSDSLIRPEFSVNDPAGVIKAAQMGGAVRFAVPFTTIKEALQNARTELAIREKAKKLIQEKFEQHFGKVLQKAIQRSDKQHLSHTQLEQVLNQKKFQKLFKQ